MNKVQILTCGGTIDKDYGSGREVTNFHISAPCIGNILLGLGIDGNSFEIQELMRKDSTENNDNDRALISDASHGSEFSKVLITHGTDSMIETGCTIGDIRGKTVYILGSHRPYSMKVNDAEDAVSYAWSELLKDTREGVFIAMNNKVIPMNRAFKTEEGDFIDQRYEYVEWEESDQQDERLVA